MKSVDITTIIGCPNQCWYCPQDSFIDNYNGIKELSLDKFKLMLNNINKDTTMINFSGYSENMRSKNIAELLLYAYNSGFVINLFTTLQWFNNDILEKLSNNISFNYVCFHEYDGVGFNREKFDLKVESFIKNINIERKFVGVGDPKYSYEIVKINSFFTRANNNKNIEPVIYKKGKISCNFYSGNLVWEVNQILPNGDIYLCCMDWSLKHKLGNIFENHYDSDEINNNRNKIVDLMNQEDSDLLCRNCEFSIFNYL